MFRQTAQAQCAGMKTVIPSPAAAGSRDPAA